MRHYVDCLAQRACHEKANIKFTTLMPGFIATDFISGYTYPLVVPLSKAAKSIYRAIVRQKRAAYLPFRWNLIVFLWKMIPKWAWERYW
jgi:short-subunit dehydrogenase